MQVVFNKQQNRAYTIEVIRCDRVKLQFQGVGKKFLVPHDLSHFIVESKLNMRQGFWGCVANGALLPGMNIVEGRQKPNARSRSEQVIQEASQQLRLAECLVRVFDEVYTVKGDRILRLARDRIKEISAEIKPSEFSDAAILDICFTLKDFQTNWQVINIGEKIELGWNQKFPSKSFDYVGSC